MRAAATTAIDTGPAASIGSTSHAVANPRPPSSHVRPAARQPRIHAVYERIVAITAYDMPIEGRDEWLAAVERLA
jgi:hypothetical protein